MTNESLKPLDSPMIARQKQMVERMRREVLPPESGVGVGGPNPLPPVLQPEAERRAADEPAPRAEQR